MNETELADKRRSINRRILELRVMLAKSKRSFFNGGAETPLSIRTEWDLEIAELALEIHDVETLQSKSSRNKKEFRASNLQSVLVNLLHENKLDHYVDQAVARCDEMRTTA